MKNKNNKKHSELLKQIHRSRFTPNNVTYGLRILAWTLFTSSGITLLSSGGTINALIGTIILGSMYAHGIELQHQALHYTGFSNRRANYYIGVILGLPMLVSFSSYRRAHIKHHQLLGTKEDVEFFHTEQTGPHPTLVKKTFNILNNMLMTKHFTQAINKIYTAQLRPVEATSMEKCEAREHQLMFVILLAIGGFSLAMDSTLAITHWLVPLFFISAPLHFLIEFPEHHGCDATKTDVFENTRTISTNWLVYWFVNGNNYHVEHHLAPGLPLQETRQLHREIRKHLTHVSQGYLRYFTRLMRDRNQRI